VADSRKRSRPTALARLNAIVDVDASRRAGWDPVTVASAFLDGGVTFLQLRAKSLAGSSFLHAAVEIVERARRHHALVIINDRPDIAVLSAADGVHLGQTDLDPARARRVLGAGPLIGRSTHTADELDRAAREPIDYLAIGPVFGTATKLTGHQAVGLAMVRRAADAGRPVVAIGGITLENAPSVIEAGARSVAVISDLLVGDPAVRARAFVERLSRL
jgi:thiamine-phosphate pyrophosphorylase